MSSRIISKEKKEAVGEDGNQHHLPHRLFGSVLKHYQHQSLADQTEKCRSAQDDEITGAGQ
jgi:hypothetical protein